MRSARRSGSKPTCRWLAIGNPAPGSTRARSPFSELILAKQGTRNGRGGAVRHLSLSRHFPPPVVSPFFAPGTGVVANETGKHRIGAEARSGLVLHRLRRLFIARCSRSNDHPSPTEHMRISIMRFLTSFAVSTLTAGSLIVVSGCVTNPTMGTAATPSQPTTTSAIPVRAPTRSRNSRQGQTDYLLDHQTATSLCSSQSYQKTYRQSVNRAQTSAAISQIAYSIGAYIPGASRLAGLGSAAGNIAATQVPKEPQFDHAACVNKYMRERGW